MASRDWDITAWRRAADLKQRAERIQRNFLQMAVGSQFYGHGARPFRWEPRINVSETAGSLWVIAAIPGVGPENVDVRIEGRQLVISGQRPLPECCKDGELRVWEMPFGRFEKRIAVADGGRALSVQEVVLKDGLLIIELRKMS